jgi:hypothetical protein
LIGYVEQMNDLHVRFSSSELDASIAGLERLRQNKSVLAVG